ncbi:MAG: serine--tRNA ligase [Bacteroidetes bacterium HGW-Bacteroidetes-11]|jgi:seryl-tRNA synthetase|nr:MAG: serine--tRNA ligase [Bacteroidetes bacterium HGW-Bacteroidetes-11]
MLELNYIRENAAEVAERLAIKNIDAAETLQKIIDIDARRREAQKNLDDNLAEANNIARQVGELFKAGKTAEASVLKARTAELKILAKDLSENLDNLVIEQNNALVLLPNVPHPSVPRGKTPEDNEIVHSEGTMPELYEGAVPHWDLASKYDIIDFELGNKVTGAGFPFYKGQGARLQRALIGFFLDNAVEAGYLEIQPPLVVNEASGYGTGQLPDKDGQMYYCEVDKLYLIPTAEVPITNIYRDVIVKSADFPIKNAAYSNCFRREAGSYGKDVRGLNRLHQFDKVEIVQIQHPDKSYETLEEMRDYVAGLLRKLELPFRILKLCGGDMSFTSSLTYDFEVYSAAQQRWLEVSSVSNFESFQANRMKLRFKDENGKTRLCHTLNGSALALPRIVASLLENNQTAEGIRMPAALAKYTGFDMIR